MGRKQRRKAEKEKEQKEKEKEKEKETEDKSKSDGSKDSEKEKTKEKRPAVPSPSVSSSPAPSHPQYVLHRDFFDMRQRLHRKKRQAAQAREIAPLLQVRLAIRCLMATVECPEQGPEGAFVIER